MSKRIVVIGSMANGEVLTVEVDLAEEIRKILEREQ